MAAPIDTPTGIRIEVLDDIRALSVRRYAAFSSAWCEHVAIGSDPAAANAHLARLAMFMGGGQLEAAVAEFNNYLLLLKRSEANYHTGITALAPLVASIDGRPCAEGTDHYAATAQLLLNSGITEEQAREALETALGKFERR